MTRLIQILNVLVSILPNVIYGQSAYNKNEDTSNYQLIKNLEIFTQEIKNNQFEILKTKRNIPKFIKRKLNKLAHGYSIADSSEEWQCCCTSSKKLPERQLTFLAKNSNVFLMIYKTGGWGTMEHLILIRYSRNRITELLALHGLDEVKSIKELIGYMDKIIRDKENHQIDFEIW